MPVTLTEVGPLCECGCGEHLPIGSVRKYKRGHRSRENQLISAEMERNGVFDGYEFRQHLPYNAEPIDTGYPSSIIEDDMTGLGWETIQDAADNVPNDPEGANFWENHDQSQVLFQQEFKIPRSAVKDIEGKVAFMLLTTGNAIGLVDGVCGNAILENSPRIAKSLTPILCQSPGVVAWFTKTSNVMLYVNLAMALAPVVMTVMSHHLPGGNKEPEFDVVPNGQMNINPDMYRVQ
jgi:hypothetical protein